MTSQEKVQQVTSRETVLTRVRDALTDVVGDAPAVPRAYRRSHAGSDPVGLFAERAADYRAEVTRVLPDKARSAIATALHLRGVRNLVVPAGFPADLLPDGPWRLRSDSPPLTVRELDAADAVLTTCALAIAVTGTLVLDAGPGQGRRALTLLPDYHLCVVRAADISGDVPEALERLRPRHPLTFVSGPSATSDIELERVEGVHGPRTLDILIIEP
jgi:L-lactate dehydrogenase complex protein LldG